MSDFNLSWDVDTAKLEKLVQTLQNVKTEAQASASALTQVGNAAGGGVTQGIQRATQATHEFSLANAGVVRELSVMFGETMRGNWSRLEGSLTVLANRTGLLAMAFTPVGAAIGAVAAAAFVLFEAYSKGAAEQTKFNNALILTGNYAGTTTAGLREMAKEIATGNTTIGTAKEAVEKLAASGRFTASEVSSIGKAAAEMSSRTGVSLDTVIKQFERLADEPAKASMELNKQYHYLTEAVYEQIKALEEQGHKQDAADLAERTYADAMAGRAKQIEQNLGYLQTAWQKLAKTASQAWNDMMGLGRTQTPEEQLATLQKRIDALQSGRTGNYTVDGRAKMISDLQEQIRAIGQGEFRKSEAAGAQAQIAADNEAAIAAVNSVARLQEKLKGQEAVNRELKKYHDQLDAIRKVNPNSERLAPDAVKRGEDEIHKLYGGSKSGHYSDQNAGIEALRGQIEQRKVLYELDVKNLQVSLAKGEITEEQYNKKVADAHIAELNDEMATALKAKAIAESKGANFKAQAQQWQNVYDKAALDKKIAQANEEKADRDHLNRINAISNEALLQAKNFNAQRLAQLDKAQRQLFMTDAEKKDADDREAIEIRYQALIDAEILKLDKEHASMAQVTAAVDALNQKKKEALNQEEAANAKRIASQQDWQGAASKAFRQYLEDAQNTAKQTGDLFTKAFSGMEDALVNFATTGKMNFKSLAQSIIADLIRIQIRAAMSGIMKMLVSGMGGGLGASAGAVNGVAGDVSMAALAANGGVWAGGTRLLAAGDVLTGPRLLAGGSALAGEAGPEAVMPLKRLSNGNLGVQAQGGSGSVYAPTITVQVSSNSSDPNTVAKQVAAEIAKQQAKMATIADGRIMNAYRPGGIIHKMTRG